jgi:hypothetical protein
VKDVLITIVLGCVCIGTAVWAAADVPNSGGCAAGLLMAMPWPVLLTAWLFTPTWVRRWLVNGNRHAQ